MSSFSSLFLSVSGYYLVFYLRTARGVDIVRVLQGARDIHNILAEEFGVEPE